MIYDTRIFQSHQYFGLFMRSKVIKIRYVALEKSLNSNYILVDFVFKFPISDSTIPKDFL